MEMIILRHNVKDPYGICGIKYFLSKSGIPIKENINKKARIDILYGNGIEKNSDFAIQINNKAAGKDAFELSFIINKKDDMISIDTDIFSLSGKILSGELEKYFPGMGIKEKKDKVSSPILDRAGKLLTDCLISASRELDIPLIQKSFWPEGKKFAVCLTHDIDEIRKTYQWITYPVRFARKMDFNRVYYQFISFLDKIKGREPYWTFGELMDIESKRNVRSTFFFLNERGKVRILDKRTWRHAGRRYDFNDSKVSGIIRELNNKGWDVGLHGSFYSYDDCNSLIMEKKLLENVFKSRVYGIRQHNLNLRIPETWLYQEKTGFEYDTTLGFNDCIGFRWGTCFPFRPFYAQENRSMDIIEIPLIIEDTAFLRSDNPWEEYARISKEVEDCEGVLTLLWHHSVFNENEFPGWGDAYEKIIDLCLKKNAWITSARDISNWWRHREGTDIEWEYEGTFLRITPHPEETNHFLNVHLPRKMELKRISGARIIENNETVLAIQINNLKDGQYVEIELSELNHGN